MPHSRASVPLVAMSLTLGASCSNDTNLDALHGSGPGPVERKNVALLLNDAQTPLGGFETHIAVSPTDQRIVAVARGCQVQVSQTGPGGLPAATVITLPMPPVTHTNGCGGDDVLAFDSQGRLFVTYLGFRLNNNPPPPPPGVPFNNRPDVLLQRIDPATGNLVDATGDVCGSPAATATECPMNVTAALGLASRNDTNPGGGDHDKSWLAADASTTSMFRDNLYVVWVDFNFDITGDGVGDGGTTVLVSSSSSQGATWSAAQVLSSGAMGNPGANDGFRWPPHVAVAVNGDVYAGFHSQPTFLPPGGSRAQPDASGQLVILRGVNGGQFTAANRAIIPANVTFNVQQCNCTAQEIMNMTCPNTAGVAGVKPCARTLNGNQSWTQGTAQPWIVTDPTSAANVAVVYSVDPTPGMDGGNNDDMDVVIAASTMNGANGSFTTTTVPQPAAGAGQLQLFPNAAAAGGSQCVTVAYYDARNPNAGNLNGNSLLDVFAIVSPNPWAAAGPTWLAERQLNDATNAFDPDVPAGQNGFDRFPVPPGGNAAAWQRTTRMGEFFGITHGAGVAWTGNVPGTSNQIIYADYSDGIAPAVTAPAAVTVNTCQPPAVALGTATATDQCGLPFSATTAVDLKSTFPATPLVPGANTVTWTGTDGALNTGTANQSVTVVDTTLPVVTPPPDKMVNNCGPVDLGGPATATDDCGSATVGPPNAPASFPVGTTIVTWTATDTSNNKGSAKQKVTVVDTVKPVFTFVPGPITITKCTGANIGMATAKDDCGIMSVLPNAPAKFPLGTTIVTWTATDTSGNKVTATQKVTAVLGDDTSCCPSGTNIIVGTSASDQIVGTAGSDCILGRGGDDVIDARDGNDFVSGGAGRDTIFAGNGNDRVYGGDGDDIINATPGTNFVDGGPGTDTCTVGTSDTVISCNP